VKRQRCGSVPPVAATVSGCSVIARLRAISSAKLAVRLASGGMPILRPAGAGWLMALFTADAHIEIRFPKDALDAAIRTEFRYA
jgi:hypothetical protein